MAFSYISCLKIHLYPFLDQKRTHISLSISSPSFLSLSNRPKLLIFKHYHRKTLHISNCIQKLTQNSQLDNEPNSDQRPQWLQHLKNELGTKILKLKEEIGSIKRIRKMIISPKFLVPIILGILFFVYKFATRANLSKEVPYSELILGLKLGQISTVIFVEDSRRIHFKKFNENNDENDQQYQGRYYTRKIDRDEKFLLNLIREKGVIYSSAPPSVSRALASSIGAMLALWIGLIPAIWILERRLNGNKKKKRKINRQKKVSFDEVQGVDYAKEELLEVVNCLHGSLEYAKLGAKLPAGILLVGPPGTGKTLLARAVAGESAVPFFSVSASEFVELYVGRGAARVRDLFGEARAEAPSIVFIDELDAVGVERDSHNAERDQTLNQLLTEMDGFDSDTKVIVIAATNRPDALDAALCRPGRFSRKIYVGEPDLEGRRKILAVHLRNVPLDEERETICDLVASLTPGFVGADLANVVNEAALLAARRGGGAVTREDIMDAVEREKFGVNGKKSSFITQKSEGLVKLFPWFPSFARGNGGM